MTVMGAFWSSSLLNIWLQCLNLRSDSYQSRALVSSRVTSKLAQKCNQVLNRLGRNHKVVYYSQLCTRTFRNSMKQKAYSLAWEAVLMLRNGFPTAATWSYLEVNCRQSCEDPPKTKLNIC
jgi:hypothetical protein